MKILSEPERKNFEIREFLLLLKKLFEYLKKDNKIFIPECFQEDLVCKTLSLSMLLLKNNFQTKVFSQVLIYPKEFNRKDLEILEDSSLEKFIQLFEEARNLGIKFEEKFLSFDEILRMLQEGFFIFCRIDLGKILELEKQLKSYVAIIGSDKNSVYILNPYENDPREFLIVQKEKFENSRKIDLEERDLISIKLI